MELVYKAFIQVAYASAMSTIIIFLILFLNKALHKYISPRVKSILWIIVIIRLIVPVVPESEISLFNLIPQSNLMPNFEYKNDIQGIKPSDNISNAKIDGIKNSSDTNNIQNQQLKQSASINPKDEETTLPLTQKNQKSLLSMVYKLVAYIWLFGTILVGLYICMTSLLFFRKIKYSSTKASFEVLDILNSCKERLGINKKVSIYIVKGIQSPFVTGFLTPKIYLSEEILKLSDSYQLIYILLHELGHYKRKDLLINKLSILAISLHWFNPVVWYAVKRMKSDREIACDAYVLEYIGDEKTTDYGMTILELSRIFTKKYTIQNSLLNFFESKSRLEKRITMINRFKKGSYKISALTVALCILLGTITLTNASEIDTNNVINNISTNALIDTSDKADIWKLLGQAKYKSFVRLDRAQDFAGFNFEVPDYIPKDFELSNIELAEKEIDNNNLIQISYYTDMRLSKNATKFLLSVSKGNLLQNTKLGKNSRYEEEKVNFSNMDAVIFTEYIAEVLETDKLDGHKSKTVETEKKYLIWQDEGIWYKVKYYQKDNSTEGKSTVSLDVPLTELHKIIETFKLPKDAKNVDYITANQGLFSIYGEKELNNAKEFLNFNPKLPVNLTDKFKIRASFTLCSQESEETYPLLITTYKPTSKAKVSQTVEFQQGKGSALYDRLAEKGYNSITNLNTNKKEKFWFKKDNIAGIDVFVDDDQKNDISSWECEAAKDYWNYVDKKKFVWKQNNLYYSATFSRDIENMEEIVEEIIKSE